MYLSVKDNVVSFSRPLSTFGLDYPSSFKNDLWNILILVLKTLALNRAVLNKLNDRDDMGIVTFAGF